MKAKGRRSGQNLALDHRETQAARVIADQDVLVAVGYAYHQGRDIQALEVDGGGVLRTDQSRSKCQSGRSAHSSGW